MNASSASPVWTKLSGSRFDSISLGWDGSVWATVLPVAGTWGVYSYDGTANWTKYPGSFKSVNARSITELWALAPDGSLWQSLQGQAWVSVSSPNPFTQISVGSDGTVWGSGCRQSSLAPTADGWHLAESERHLCRCFRHGWHADRSRRHDGSGYDRGCGTCSRDAAAVESPFVVSAYSGGNATYSDAQNSQVGWATLTVNQKSLIGRVASSVRAPTNGLNVAAVDSTGAPLSIVSYDTGTDRTESDQFAADMASLITSKSKLLAENLYSAFQESGGLNGGKGPLLSDGSPNVGPNWGINLAGNLVYTGSCFRWCVQCPCCSGRLSTQLRLSGRRAILIGQHWSRSRLLEGNRDSDKHMADVHETIQAHCGWNRVAHVQIGRGDQCGIRQRVPHSRQLSGTPPKDDFRSSSR